MQPTNHQICSPLTFIMRQQTNKASSRYKAMSQQKRFHHISDRLICREGKKTMYDHLCQEPPQMNAEWQRNPNG